MDLNFYVPAVVDIFGCSREEALELLAAVVESSTTAEEMEGWLVFWEDQVASVG